MTRSHSKKSLASTARMSPWVRVGPVALVALAALTALSNPARAQDGLRSSSASPARAEASAQTTPHWQARFGVASPVSADPSARLQGTALHLLGDYYWQGFRPARFGLSGGFRATSGLLVGERALSLAPPWGHTRGNTGAGAGMRGLRLGEAEREVALAVPYVGVGYSGVSLRGGWGFTADLGLAGTGTGLQTRRDLPAQSRGADEILRELRLTPILQIGASYAF